MLVNSGQRASLIIQARLGAMPKKGTLSFEHWLCAQQAGRVYLDLTWDCSECNPDGLPPERLHSANCLHAEELFTEAMEYRCRFISAMEQDRRTGVRVDSLTLAGEFASRAVTNGHLHALVQA